MNNLVGKGGSGNNIVRFSEPIGRQSFGSGIALWHDAYCIDDSVDHCLGCGGDCTHCRKARRDEKKPKHRPRRR